MRSSGGVSGVVMAGLDFAPPKYARVVLELQRRIESGELRPGDALPSETQLVREFAVGRTTVVRALHMLQQDGWITREHGRGSFVKGRPVGREKRSRPGLAVLDQPTGSGLVAAGPAEAPASVAARLGVDSGDRLVMRRWVGEQDDVVSELVTCWFPPALAEGTDLGAERPLRVGVREHLRTVKGLRIDHICERLTARAPLRDEAGLLKIKPVDAVLAISATVHDAADVPRFVVDVVMPGALHELEDVYSIPE